MVLPDFELSGENRARLLSNPGAPRDAVRAREKSAADVFRRFGLGATGFWQSVAVPADSDLRPAAKLRSAFEELGGVYLVFARFLLWRADLLSTEYLEPLREIDYSLPPIPRSHVIALVRSELGSRGAEIAAHLESEPVWSTLARTAYVSWFDGRAIVVQVGRDPIPEGDLARFESGIGALGHADICHIASPRILKEFREWVRQAESTAVERSYLQTLARNRGETLVDYPELIEEITTDRVLCWPWIEGETIGSLIGRGDVDGLTQVAIAVFEELFTLSLIDADLETDAMVIPADKNRLVVRRINRPLSVPPPAVNLGMKYIAAVLEGNASLTVHNLLTLAVGRSTADLEIDLLNLISGVEPELKVRRWYPDSAAAFESNWRALGRLEVTRPRPLYLDCLQRNLIAIGYWTPDAVRNGGRTADTISAAHMPVVQSIVRRNASQFLDQNVLAEWSMGLGLLTFGAIREANRLAEELRESDLTYEVEMPEAQPDIRKRNTRRSGGNARVIVSVALLLAVLFATLRWGSTVHGLARGFVFAMALAAIAGLFWVVAKID